MRGESGASGASTNNGAGPAAMTVCGIPLSPLAFVYDGLAWRGSLQ
jgi:hypothetical protein